MVALPERLTALDVFRGLTIAVMIIVNNPGNWDHVYPALRHSDWQGCTPADLVFPFFLFIVGVSTWLSQQARRRHAVSPTDLRRQSLKRAALLCLIGLAVTWITGSDWDGLYDQPFGHFMVERCLHWRIPGVLQRIGIVYGVVALLGLEAGPRLRWTLTAGLLLGYWAILTILPVPETGATGLAAIADPTLTNAAWVDRWLFDWGSWGQHLWRESKLWDPEGALSTLPAIVTGLLGLEAGRWLSGAHPLPQRLRGLALAGLAGILAGLLWNLVFPFNKALWSSSYVLFTAGLAALAIAGLTWLIDLRQYRRWTPFFLAFGLNPILAYIGDETVGTLLYEVVSFPTSDGRISVVELLYQQLLRLRLSPDAASLAFALIVLFLWYGLFRHLQRRRIVLKI